MASAKVAADLAASLATIAIASLGGPMAAGGVALGQVVKHAQAAYMANVETRDLRRRVSSVIASWAVSEGLNAEVEPGMALAARVLSEHGLTTAGLARLDFDADRITRRVVTAARAADKAAAQKNDQPSYWDTEPHYAVATRVVRVTYDALTRQLQAGDQVLLAAIAAVRHDIDGHVVRLRESGQRIEASLTELLAALVAAASAADVMSYLRARLSDWDVSVWHPDRQALSTLERRLQVQASHASEHHRGELTADEALQGTRMLIVLGGPGSGKTWQAYRYARQAARLALSRLEEGAGLEEVEIPLYTTWDHWVKTGGNGGTRESLVTASLSSGLGHTDPERVESLARLSRTLGQATTKVLFVVDSLDEAADLTRQDARLRELSGAISCRVVVTSRPAAWAAARRATASGPDEALVVDLMPLEYPKDVEGFVRAWFDHDPGRATALLGQMRDRDDLQQAAVVPLLLTFYCLITEVADDANAPLPARRRLLFRRLVKRLLRSAWTMDGPGIDAAPDDDQCSEVLSRWAWSAVRDRVTATGLGNWGDSFTQPESLPPTIARPIDHVAPKVAVDGEGGITRRFVHRTLLEHFVAEHMASLAVGEAAEQLLPHLWFDPDWQVALPAAVAAHPLCGELLRQLRDVAETPARDAARRTAAIQIDEMLLAIAVESEPDDWPAAESAAIHQCRIRNAVARPSHLARSAHWTSSNAEARAALLGALPGADLLAVRELTTVLQALGAPRSERAEARATVLAALPDTPAWALDGLLSVLEGLTRIFRAPGVRLGRDVVALAER